MTWVKPVRFMVLSISCAFVCAVTGAVFGAFVLNVPLKDFKELSFLTAFLGFGAGYLNARLIDE